MRLLQLTYKREFSSDQWPHETIPFAEDPEVVKAWHEQKDVLHPENGNPDIRFHCEYFEEEDPLYSYQWFWFNDLPDPAPEMLLDWFVENSRRWISHYLNNATANNGTPYCNWVFWSTNYKRDTNIIIDDIEVVDSDTVSQWPK